MTIHRCGPLSFDADTGRCYFGDHRLDIDGKFSSTALAAALMNLGFLEDPADVQPVQTSFEFPTEPPPPKPLQPGDTLEEAHRRVHANLDKGIICPVCERPARRYKRAIHAEMARAFGHLVRRHYEKPGYYSLRDFIPGNTEATKASSDISYLVHWNALKRHPFVRGKYMPLPKGIAWYEGTFPLPRFAWVYNDIAYFSAERISYKDALEQPFDLFGMLGDDDGPSGR